MCNELVVICALLFIKLYIFCSLCVVCFVGVLENESFYIFCKRHLKIEYMSYITLSSTS